MAAEMGTKRRFCATLSALWYYTFPDLACPFAGVRLIDDGRNSLRSSAIAEGDFTQLLTPKSGALTPSEFRRALTGALYYDTELGNRPNLQPLMLPNTTYAIAIQTALGLRISELAALRWGYINFGQRYVLVTGTKTRRSYRVVPLQEQLIPWLEELREREGGAPDPRSFVIRTDPRRGPLSPPAQSTLINRYARALRYSGLKRPKKSTHWARATHATWGATATAIITTEALKAYLGHKTRYAGSTDAYIHIMLEIMPDDHRRYIMHLPSPAEVRAALHEFTPAAVVSWRDRRIWQSRSQAATQARHERAVSRRFLHDRLELEEGARPTPSSTGAKSESGPRSAAESTHGSKA